MPEFLKSERLAAAVDLLDRAAEEKSDFGEEEQERPEQGQDKVVNAA
jgi:hypothetical protein